MDSVSPESQDDLNIIKAPAPLSFQQKAEAFEPLNKSHADTEEMPKKTKHLIEKKYPKAKIKKTTEVFRTKMFNLN